MPTAPAKQIAIPTPPEHSQDVAVSSASKAPPTAMASPSQSNYRGFVAGVFSGIAKLAVGHPFDTIKVRLQTAPRSQFRGPLECLTQTLRREGFSGLYKGATPPLVGWMFMDSLMLGSLTFYRRTLNETFFNPGIPPQTRPPLPTSGQALSGIMAGWTVSFIAAPVEHIKARLQIQYAADRSKRLYRGPIDCFKKIYASHGIPGLYHGLSATLLFRSFFCVWWGSYDIITRSLTNQTLVPLSVPAVNFLAGGLSAQLFWIAAYPSDVVKQRIMTTSLSERRGMRLGMWSRTAKELYANQGWKGFWRGFLPCFLRAFPANAMALGAFEGAMRMLP